MGKKVALILGLLLIVSLAFAQESKWTDIVNKYYEERFCETSDSYRSWKEGCKEGFKLDLKKLEFKATVVEEVEKEGITYVRVVLEIYGKCLDEAGLKKQVTTIRMVAFKIIDGAIVQGVYLGEIKPPTVFDGWDEAKDT